MARRSAVNDRRRLGFDVLRQTTEHFESVDDLMSALQRRDDRWQPEPRSWLFRGHSDATWSLTPSALRNPTKLTHHPRRNPKPYERVVDQVRQEIAAVLAFVTEANQHGLPIPGYASNVLRLLQQEWYEVEDLIETWSQFPSKETVESFALAQHHGVPTRLLDWTRSPRAAAYFAASGAAQALNAGTAAERLAIWCFQPGVLAWTKHIGHSERIEVIDPPRAPNKNLLAQNGVFTLHIHGMNRSDETLVTPLDSVVRELYGSAPMTVHEGTPQPVHCLTFPTSQARLLLAALAEEDVTAANLFPGYDGVVRELNERMYLRQTWRCPPESE